MVYKSITLQKDKSLEQ